MQDKWCTQIDEITHHFRQAFGSLTPEELNWRPNAQTWSIGQNMDHLIVINGTYFPVIQAVRAGTYRLPFQAKFNWVVVFLGRTVLKAVQPDRRKKMKTFPIWEPTSSQVPANIWERFEAQQEALKALVQASADLLDHGTVISSPANRHIVYKLETAFDIIVAHERRHFEQAKELDGIRKHTKIPS